MEWKHASKQDISEDTMFLSQSLNYANLKTNDLKTKLKS